MVRRPRRFAQRRAHGLAIHTEFPGNPGDRAALALALVDDVPHLLTDHGDLRSGLTRPYGSATAAGDPRVPGRALQTIIPDHCFPIHHDLLRCVMGGEN